MFFSSTEFIFAFLPISLILYYGLGRINVRLAAAWLAVVSITYYGWFNPFYLPLLFGSLAFNYGVSIAIDRFALDPSRQIGVLTFGIVINLVLLFFFKYLSPIASYYYGSNHVFSAIALPIGISFFTFTQIAFLIDHKQGLAQERNIVNYVVFVTFFPHIVAGPILHHKEMMPQFADRKTYVFRASNIFLGLAIFGVGLIKKLIFADQAKIFADISFNHPENLSLIGAWTGVLFYTLQLYFDFSGYSDMAIGLARMFGVKFPVNFNSPFKARNMIEFWQRWHMTLTRYLTVYVFNPLALWVARRRLANNKPVNRKATETINGFMSMIAFPTLVTMLGSGVWHGAGMHFAAWGGVYAMFLILNHLWRNFSRRRGQPAKSSRGREVFDVGLTFMAVISAMVLFRADSLKAAGTFYQAMLGMNGLISHQNMPSLTGNTIALLQSALKTSAFEITFLVASYAIIWGMPNTQEIFVRYEPILESKSIRHVALINWLMRPDFASGVCRVFMVGAGIGVIAIALLSTGSNAKPFVYAFF